MQEAAANRIKKKYDRQRQKDLWKIKSKRAANWLRKTGYLDIDDLATVDYNNDVNLDDVAIEDYNMDTQPSELDNEIYKIDLKNNSKNAQEAAKKK